jgi:hypothetical protein
MGWEVDGGCKDGRWMELAQDRVQWRVLILVVLNPRVLLLECMFRKSSTE